MVTSDKLAMKIKKNRAREIFLYDRMSYQSITCGNRYCGEKRLDLQRCSRCHVVCYCDRVCQRLDWNDHKLKCRKQDKDENKDKPVKEQDKKPNTTPDVGSRHTADGQRLIEETKEQLVRFSNSIQECQNTGLDMHSPEMLIFLKKLIPGELQIHPRPLGSLDNALAFAKLSYLYPTWDIIDSFSEIPPELTGLRFPMSCFMPRSNYVAVAFIFIRNDHVMRHGVYLKDSSDKINYLEFYLDNDNPSPFFNYSHIKPGNYILLENPVKHRFMDGQVGIRVDDPSTVKIYNPQFDLDVSAEDT